MLLWLADYLSQYTANFQVFQYLTLRTALGVLTSLAISLLVGPWLIERLNYHQIGQSVRRDGPESPQSKSGTPTMGGALILVSLLVTTLLWSDLSNPYVWAVIGVVVIFGAVGWVDDYRKVIEKIPGACPPAGNISGSPLGGWASPCFCTITPINRRIHSCLCPSSSIRCWIWARFSFC